ncbi:hypothetical protein G5C51_33110 [Streptomyces sp. A7024]|uniref:ABM domain-containing protein n=1 Tax=Streptomyces coryli TaxID=1128680 RepID=A0A6G4UBF9_9ACTN|nr:hypothetical protein [Streptomyces coryli]NGN68718.1 hypothetical protein [Streptomyces coryli]
MREAPPTWEGTMEFIQIIDYETDKPEQMQALADQFRKEREGQSGGPARITVVQDRNNRKRHLTIAEFDSYEEAQRNNDRPETQKFAEQMMALCTKPAVFIDCDLRQQFTR